MALLAARRRRRGRGLAAVGALSLLLAGLAPDGGAQDRRLETAVKATYLYKLAPFVTWPANALAPSAPFEICVVGADPFGAVLDQAVAGQTVGDHRIEVRRLAQADAASPCAMMYLGGSRAQPVAEALKALHGAPVLTVTDGGNGGMVDFAVVGGRVRLRIDEEAAAQARLTISSKLLSLALSVRTRTPGPRP